MAIESKRFGLRLNVEHSLTRWRFPQDFENVFERDGQTLSAADAATFLALEKAKGRVVIPMAGDCANPCPHAAQGCSGFDYSGAGCPGHRVDG